MKVIENNIIPFGKYTAITLWPFIFVKRMMKHTVGHETIHWHQQLEVLTAVLAVVIAAILFGASAWWLCAVPVSYYTLYCAEWAVRLAIHRDGTEAYRNISHEQEAYMHEAETDYIAHRKPFAWLGYITSKTYTKQT